MGITCDNVSACLAVMSYLSLGIILGNGVSIQQNYAGGSLTPV